MKNKSAHDPKPPAAGSVMDLVAQSIAERNLSLKSAAGAIRVGVQTLQKHLSGEHVRSDSERKYLDWLSGRADTRNVFVLPTRSPDAEPDVVEAPLMVVPDRPRLVVDIFAGCGGLSLGFDLLDGGRQFRTILAVDNQAAPIAVLNRNARILQGDEQGVGRQMDLTEFMNEPEFLAFYIEHVARVTNDSSLASELATIRGRAFPTFLKRIASADSAFVEALDLIRSRPDWRLACEGLDRQCLSQTSVIGFHEKLRLPRPSTRPAALPMLLWSRTEDTGPIVSAHSPDDLFLKAAEIEWDVEVASLSSKSEASGRGQLNASARRVGAFVAFLRTGVMASVRDAWVHWRACRLTARTLLFENPQFATALRELYETRCQVSVLVGGPPCQGFSRIGRGKIRSLREASVHVHGDADAGDARNMLFRQYVMVLGALRPEVFLFENVQHFQSTVKADGIEFDATEVLAEAIENVSGGEANYEVSSKVLDASKFGVPQARQRFFMAGVLARGGKMAAGRDAADCLNLRRLGEAPLSLALAGLPRPHVAGSETLKGSDAMSVRSPIDVSVMGDHPYSQWVRQPVPGLTDAPFDVDAHAARAARADDAAFFGLMGPGKRWMDYRSDSSETVNEIGELLDALLSMSQSALSGVSRASKTSGKSLPDRVALESLRAKVDGSLPLRLMLEQAGGKLGAPHHLLTESYLAKRDGHHGDWVARMDASRPSKTMVSHMGKDTYAYVHPFEPRTISVREAARIQSFPDWFGFGGVALTDAFKMIGNAVPPMLGHSIAHRVAQFLGERESGLSRGQNLAHGWIKWAQDVARILQSRSTDDPLNPILPVHPL